MALIVKKQEYLRDEIYYFIETKKQGQYLGISYSKPWESFTLQLFTEDKNKEGFNLIPHITKRFIFNIKEINILLKMITIIWNNQYVSNEFKVMEDLIHKLSLNLLCSSIPEDKRALQFKFKIKQKINHKDSFDILLSRNQCRQLYAVLLYIIKEEKLC